MNFRWLMDFAFDLAHNGSLGLLNPLYDCFFSLGKHNWKRYTQQLAESPYCFPALQCEGYCSRKSQVVASRTASACQNSESKSILPFWKYCRDPNHIPIQLLYLASVQRDGSWGIKWIILSLIWWRLKLKIMFWMQLLSWSQSTRFLPPEHSCQCTAIVPSPSLSINRNSLLSPDKDINALSLNCFGDTSNLCSSVIT